MCDKKTEAHNKHNLGSALQRSVTEDSPLAYPHSFLGDVNYGQKEAETWNNSECCHHQCR